MTEFLNALILGIETGAFYSLIALGLNVIFAATNVYNFAQGDMAALATVVGLLFWRSAHVPVVAAFALTVVVASCAGPVIDHLAVRTSTRRQEASGWVLSLLGVSVIASSIGTKVIAHESSGSSVILFPSVLPLKSAYHLHRLIIQPSQLLVVGVMLVTAGALMSFTRYSSYGRALQAVADDTTGAAIRGLPVGLLRTLSFAIGGAIAAVAGFVGGPVTGAAAGVGFTYTLKGFIAATLGGIPSYGGAVIGGLVLGVVEQMTALYTNGNYESIVSLALLLLVLLIRPHGILGRVGRPA